MGAGLGFLMNPQKSQIAHGTAQDFNTNARTGSCVIFSVSALGLTQCHHHCTLIAYNCHTIPPISSGLWTCFKMGTTKDSPDTWGFLWS